LLGRRRGSRGFHGGCSPDGGANPGIPGLVAGPGGVDRTCDRLRVAPADARVAGAANLIAHHPSDKRRRKRGSPRAEGRSGEEESQTVERRGKLRRGHLRRRHDQKNLVSSGLRGVGLGLRAEFIDELAERVARPDAPRLPIDFVEIAPENYVRRGGRARRALDAIAARLPVVTHGLTMSLGGTDPLDAAYLEDLRCFVATMGSPWHSDHVCFGEAGGRVLHDLLPVAFTRTSASAMADRTRRARDALGVPMALENISYYWHPGRADLREAEFLSEVCAAADCGLLLDVNNLFVNAVNFGFDPEAWLRSAPLERVVQIHVAGHEWFEVGEEGIGDSRSPHAKGAMIIDTHGADVSAAVWALLSSVLERTGPRPVVIERDRAIPPFDVLLAETARLRVICEEAAAVWGHREVGRERQSC